MTSTDFNLQQQFRRATCFGKSKAHFCLSGDPSRCRQSIFFIDTVMLCRKATGVQKNLRLKPQKVGSGRMTGRSTWTALSMNTVCMT